LLRAGAQSPFGLWTVVAFIYAGFGLAFFESTPYDPEKALRLRLVGNLVFIDSDQVDFF